MTIKKKMDNKQHVHVTSLCDHNNYFLVQKKNFCILWIFRIVIKKASINLIFLLYTIDQLLTITALKMLIKWNFQIVSKNCRFALIFLIAYIAIIDNMKINWDAAKLYFL